MKKQVVILLHGIRTHADWQQKVADGLLTSMKQHGYENVEVKLLGYEFFNLLQFLTPIAWVRDRPITHIAKEFVKVRVAHPDAEISVVAHSFGTYILGEILKARFEMRLKRVILVGSVLSTQFDWHLLAPQRVKGVLNEVGTRDVWPILAKSLSWVYGMAGSYGFRQATVVVDRFWHTGHSCLLTREHAERYWGPYLANGDVGKGETDESPNYFLKLLGTGLLKYCLLMAIIIGLLWMTPTTDDDEVTLRVPANRTIANMIWDEKVKTQGAQTTHSLDEVEILPLPDAGYLTLNAGQEIVLKSATPYMWCDDRLAFLDILMDSGKMLVDLKPLRDRWIECNRDIKQFAVRLKEEHDKMQTELGIVSVRDELPHSKVLQAALQIFVATLVTDLDSTLIEDRFAVVDSTYAGSLTSLMDAVPAAKRSFFKRYLGSKYLDKKYSSVQGPYFGLAGNPGANGPFFRPPIKEAPAGCLIATTHAVDSKGMGAKINGKQTFFEKGSAIKNLSSQEQVVLFMINDDIAEDNGDGYCELVLERRTPVSMLEYLFRRLR